MDFKIIGVKLIFKMVSSPQMNSQYALAAARQSLFPHSAKTKDSLIAGLTGQYGPENVFLLEKNQSDSSSLGISAGDNVALINTYNGNVFLAHGIYVKSIGCSHQVLLSLQVEKFNIVSNAQTGLIFLRLKSDESYRLDTNNFLSTPIFTHPSNLEEGNLYSIGSLDMLGVFIKRLLVAGRQTPLLCFDTCIVENVTPNSTISLMRKNVSSPAS